jgi:hypothetical protein
MLHVAGDNTCNGYNGYSYGFAAITALYFFQAHPQKSFTARHFHHQAN